MKNVPFPYPVLPTRKRHRGFTLTEIAIVLGIAGIVLAAIWVATGSVNERNKINQAVLELQTVVQNMMTLYQNRSMPTPCDQPYITSNLIDAGVIPPWMVAPEVTGGCKTAINPWEPGGSYFGVWWRQLGGSGASASGTTGNQFWVSFYNIPTDACIAILLQATNCDPAQPTCPKQVYTAMGTNLQADGLTSPTPGPPKQWQITPTNASSAYLCGANVPYTPGVSVNNSLEFLYQP